MSAKTDPPILVEVLDRVGLARIDVPETRNALSNDALALLADALDDFDRSGEIRAIVLAGTDRVFASGADLRAMTALSTTEQYFGERQRLWSVIRRIGTPVVAAVSGYCLGAGCELALMSDIVVAAESAKFGLPETKLGLIPGAGGTQRLVRSIGKARTMDMILTGRLLDANEAHTAGIVSRIATDEAWLSDALNVAREVATRSPVATRLAKEAVNTAFETALEAGLDAERKAFAIAFSSEEARAGIAAFLADRD